MKELSTIPAKQSEFTQTFSVFRKKHSNKPKVSISDLPCTKRKERLLKILPTDSDPIKFSKIFETYFPAFCFKSLFSPSPPSNPGSFPQTPDFSQKFSKFSHQPYSTNAQRANLFTPNSYNPIVSSQLIQKNSDFSEKKSYESISNISDSFMTPEESPLLMASPVSAQVSSFALESPLTHSITGTAIEGWGTKSNKVEQPSPQFAMPDPAVYNVKPVNLFPAITEDNDKKGESDKEEEEKVTESEGKRNDVIEETQGMELLASKEASVSLDTTVMRENEGLATGKSEDISISSQAFNSIMNQHTEVNPSPPISQAASNNPFLNINSASIAKPAYVFGAGISSLPPCNFGTGNPFLMSPLNN